MFSSQDGEKFGSRFKARKRDEMHSASMGKNTEKPGMEMGKESPNADTESRDTTDQQEQTSENPREVVEAHGPAHSVHVHHNHANKSHKVMSHHADGFMSESDHPTPDAAHKHAAVLGGGADMNQPPDATSEQSGDMMGEATSQGTQGLA
jgi:hypothetical protein